MTGRAGKRFEKLHPGIYRIILPLAGKKPGPVNAYLFTGTAVTLINGSTKVIVCGITGEAGGFHARQMLDYGTQVLCGVTPGRAGSKRATDKCTPRSSSGAQSVDCT